jgi:hypothetical protein
MLLEPIVFKDPQVCHFAASCLSTHRFCMFQNALASQCRLCARIAARRTLDARNAVTSTSTSTSHHQNFGTSAGRSRQLPKGGSSKGPGKAFAPYDTPQGTWKRRDGYRGSRDGSQPFNRPPYSAFKLSSETPETPTTGAGPVALDRQAILDALRSKQEELADKGHAAEAGRRGSMVAILEAIAKRLALDKVELLRLARSWAREETYPEKVDRKGKGKSNSLDDDL